MLIVVISPSYLSPRNRAQRCSNASQPRTSQRQVNLKIDDWRRHGMVSRTFLNDASSQQLVNHASRGKLRICVVLCLFDINVIPRLANRLVDKDGYARR